jgi:hypothetical protein
VVASGQGAVRLAGGSKLVLEDCNVDFLSAMEPGSKAEEQDMFGSSRSVVQLAHAIVRLPCQVSLTRPHAHSRLQHSAR